MVKNMAPTVYTTNEHFPESSCHSTLYADMWCWVTLCPSGRLLFTHLSQVVVMLNTSARDTRHTPYSTYHTVRVSIRSLSRLQVLSASCLDHCHALSLL
jgi:hypothetical protein